MKLYDSKEVRAILKIAAENSSTDKPDQEMGLTIDELRQLASEVGIDPEQITMAAAEIESNSGMNNRNFWGGPFSYRTQVLVDGEINGGREWINVGNSVIIGPNGKVLAGPLEAEEGIIHA